MNGQASPTREPSAATPAHWREHLEQAIHAHQRGDLARAEALYGQVLRRHGGQADALHFLGVLAHQRGRSDEAVTLLKRALARLPRHADAHNNLGNIHKECGRLGAAEACYRQALACAPEHHNARANLGVVLEAQGRHDEAVASYRTLVQRAPEYAHGQWLLGWFLLRHPQDMADVEQAADGFRRALERGCDHGLVLQHLGMALYALQRADEAREVYRRWLAREPHNPVPRHMLAASGGAPVPARADDAYVRQTFDHCAANFDHQLLDNLHYRAPQVLVAALREVLTADSAALDVLDGGCGTGLCGPLLRPLAAKLVGVDLSERMLTEARKRGDYDHLQAAELGEFLARSEAAWDALVAADTLVYFGDLACIARAAFRALRAGGWLLLSLEAMRGDGFELGASGRYRHGRAHVHDALGNAGFVEIVIRADSLRREAGRDVASWVVRARRAPSPHPDADGSSRT